MDRPVFQMPSPMKITGRTSSITNSFVTSIIPRIFPEDHDIAEALEILGMETNDVRCAYCGDPSTEWDHLRPLVDNKQPTGFISEIGNLVPSCGKCNQSKGNKHWRKWMLSDARLSPRTRGIPDLDKRIERLKRYQAWRPRAPLDFKQIVGEEAWNQHWKNRDRVVQAMAQSQVLASKMKEVIQASGAI